MRKISTKLIGAIASLALVLSIVGVSATQAAALTSSQISAIVSLLQSFGADATTVANVTASLTGQPTTGKVPSILSEPVNTPSCIDLSDNLYYGSRDIDTNGKVTLLQNFLRMNNYLSSEPTGYYGNMTVTAVKKFQADNGIFQAGFVGVSTRAKIKSLSCLAPVVNVTTSSVIIDSPANTQPIAPPVYTYAPSIFSLSPSSAKIGDTVTIYGSGFNSSSEVSFQGISMRPNNVSATSLSFNIPGVLSGDTSNFPPGMSVQPMFISPGSTYQISVKNSGVESNIVSLKVILDISEPKIAGLNKNSGNRGDTITIYGSGFAADAAVTFDGFKVDDNLIIHRSSGAIESTIQFKIPEFITGCSDNNYPELCPNMGLPPFGTSIETGGDKYIEVVNRVNGILKKSNSVIFTLPNKTVQF